MTFPSRASRRAATLTLAVLATLATPVLGLAASSGSFAHPAARVAAPSAAAAPASPLARRIAAARAAAVAPEDVTFTMPGNASYTVQSTGALTIEVRGGDASSVGVLPGGSFSGGFNSGSAATVRATFQAQAGDVLTVVVGSGGGQAQGNGAGGGGGSAVILKRGAQRTLLIVAGGGAGGSGGMNSASGPGPRGYRLGGGASAADGTPGGGSDGGGAGGGGGGFNGAGGGGSRGGAAGTLETGGGPGGAAGPGGGAGGFGFGGGGGGGSTFGGGGGGYGGGSAEPAAGYSPLSDGGTGGASGGTSFVAASGSFVGTSVSRTNGVLGGGPNLGVPVDGSVTLSGPATIADGAFRTVGNTTFTVTTAGALTVRARGADGGGSPTNQFDQRGGGGGAVVQATFQAQVGDVLTVIVGERGVVRNAAGGGGGSAVILERGGVRSLLVVAGGGGGSGNPGRGGGGSAADGVAAGGTTQPNGDGAAGGGGYNAAGADVPGSRGRVGSGGGAGTLAQGVGAGGLGVRNGAAGGRGFGGGGGGNASYTTGGGGGGYGGGFGGVDNRTSQGGGGGSSFVESSGPLAGTNVSRTDGVAGAGTVNGEVILSGPAARVTYTQATGYNGPAEGDGAGYRLLGAPVGGFTLRDLAALNLVQGVPAGADAAAFPGQYPAAGANVFPTYTGLGPAGFPRPTGTDQVLSPGRGFYWYLYDRDIPAGTGFGGGTSSSRELSSFQLAANGTPPAVDLLVDFADNTGTGTDDFQMLANPFGRPLAVSGITASGGVFQGATPQSGPTVQVYNPSGGAFVLLSGATRLAVWQGAFAELVPTAAGQPMTVTYAYASTDTGAPPPFYGRGTAGDPSVRFALTGTLTEGAAVADSAAVVRLVAGAEAGWDPFDLSKLTPLAVGYAMLAPVIDRDGTPYRLAIDSRPFAAQRVPLALRTTAAGTFRLSWTVDLPDGWTATLSDTQTGSVTDLASASEVPVTTTGAVDDERFVLVLTPSRATAGAETPALALGLSAPAPNPATGRSGLVLTLPTAEHVRAVVVDALGREVATLYDAEAQGTVRLSVDAARLAPGVYTVRAAGASFALSRRLTVVR